jgi:hypothetical protein
MLLMLSLLDRSSAIVITHLASSVPDGIGDEPNGKNTRSALALVNDHAEKWLAHGARSAPSRIVIRPRPYHLSAPTTRCWVCRPRSEGSAL